MIRSWFSHWSPATARRWSFPAAAVAATLLLAALVGQFWHPVYGFTALFQVDATLDDTKVAAFHAHPVYVYRHTGGYDGCYYSQLAVDPTLRDPQFPLTLDNAPYRARRILPSAVAWILGGADAGRAITIYSWLNLGVWLAMAVLLWRVLQVQTGRAWLGWAGVLFSAGALASVRLALTDLPACLLLLLAITLAERGHRFPGIAGIAAAGLARETALLGVAGLIKRPWISVKNGLRVILVTIPLVLWLIYVRFRLGPNDAGLGNFTLPLTGWVEKGAEAIVAFSTPVDRPLVITSLLAFVGLSVQALYVILKRDWQDRWWRVGAAYVLLLLTLGQAVWEGFPGAAMRVLLPLTLAFNVLAVRRRAALLWLVLGNLGIAAGLLSFRDVPPTNEQMAASRLPNGGAIVRVGEGWYAIEQARGHRWAWTSGRASLRFEAWPRDLTHVRLRFGVRSVNERTVILQQDGQEIWRGRAANERTVFEAPMTLRAGIGVVTLMTDQPPVPENPAGNGRDLAFALYDVEVLPAR